MSKVEVGKPVKSIALFLTRDGGEKKPVNRPQNGVQRSRVRSGLRVVKQGISNPGVERFMKEAVASKVKNFRHICRCQVGIEFGIWR